jgi:hypothetical protein
LPRHWPLLFHRLLPLSICPLPHWFEGITALAPALARNAALGSGMPEPGTIRPSPIDKSFC